MKSYIKWLLYIYFFFFKLKKVEKIGYLSNFNFECNTGSGSKESLSIALGYYGMIYLSGSVWLRQPVEDLRFDLGILFYGFTRCSWTIPNLRKSPFVIRAPLAPCAAVAVR